MAFAKTGLTTTQQGYGAEHQRARAKAMARLKRDGVGVCCIGGEPIYPEMGRQLHLDHTPDRQGYRGLACAEHNVRDGAKRGRARQDTTQLTW